MNIETLIDRIENTTPLKDNSPLGDDGYWKIQNPQRLAGVIIPCLRLDDGDHVLFTKRAEQLRHHAGQISFPGGRVEDDDSSVLAASLRELKEEVNHPENQVSLLAELPPYNTITGFHVTPFLTILTPPFNFIPQPSEVAEIFTVPMGHIFNPSHYQLHSHQRGDEKRNYRAIDYQNYHIWGATAGILYGLIEAIQDK